MVKISHIELPITFIKNNPKVLITFKNEDNKYYGEKVNIILKTLIPSKINEWSYTVLIQDTNKIVLSGLEYKAYTLDITTDKKEIDLNYSISWQDKFINRDKISPIPPTIHIEIIKHKNNTRQFGGGGFGGALLTTGSFTMMAASGGF